MMYWYFFWKEENEINEEEEIQHNNDGTLEITKVPHSNYKINEGGACGRYQEWYGTVGNGEIRLERKEEGLVFEVPKGLAEDDNIYYLNAKIYLTNKVHIKVIDRQCTYDLVNKYYNTDYCTTCKIVEGEEIKELAIIKIPEEIEPEVKIKKYQTCSRWV